MPLGLRTIWSASDAEVLTYMDVDLSTDLNALTVGGETVYDLTQLISGTV